MIDLGGEGVINMFDHTRSTSNLKFSLLFLRAATETCLHLRLINWLINCHRDKEFFPVVRSYSLTYSSVIGIAESLPKIPCLGSSKVSSASVKFLSTVGMHCN